MPVKTKPDVTVLDHDRARQMLGHEDKRLLTDADRNRLNLVMDTLHYAGCLSETAARRINIVANGGHVTAVMSMACVEADANRANARALAEILLTLTTGRMPR